MAIGNSILFDDRIFQTKKILFYVFYVPMWLNS